MSRPDSDPVDGLIDRQPYRHAMSGEVWECCPVTVMGPVAFRSESRRGSGDAIARLAESALLAPLDFPPLKDAVLSGDHVALAVDPNVPQLIDVLRGVIRSLVADKVGRISVVLWEECPEAMLQELQSQFENSESEPNVSVTRHRSKSRPDLRYVAADEQAEPVYLARDLVDADLTVPIIAARWSDGVDDLDRAGVFPMFADEATQARYQVEPPSEAAHVGWLLGVQLMLLVSSDATGNVASLLAGTPDALRQELLAVHHRGEFESTLSAGIIVAALDGSPAMQTWCNVARAALAASGHVEPAGAIVVWSRLTEPPPPLWQRAMIEFDEDFSDDDDSTADPSDEDLDEGTVIATQSVATGDPHLARTLARLSRQHQIWLFSELEAESVEELGLGVIDSVAALTKLAAGFGSAGVLRAAQFQSESVPRKGTA